MGNAKACDHLFKTKQKCNTGGIFLVDLFKYTVNMTDMRALWEFYDLTDFG